MTSQSVGASDNIGLLLSLASAQGVAAANAALRPMDLSTRSYTLLELIIRAGGASQRELADTLRLDPSQIVALVDGLEQRGFAQRRPNAADRRQKSVVATNRGRQAYRRARDRVEASLDEVLGELDEAERETLRALLTRIVHPRPATVERVS
ncbi:MarR family winged helix-turn-helix transcriptional regulator [Georgenia alba]|uniref:MarR family winged helix-turn-helix transcriptional regulator n=1 Tax=Georgenia alba TaxID=2233858 RepID=A0ABW2QC11_9MICO